MENLSENHGINYTLGVELIYIETIWCLILRLLPKIAPTNTLHGNVDYCVVSRTVKNCTTSLSGKVLHPGEVPKDR